MKRKFILLQAINNSFVTDVENQSVSGVNSIALTYAKERGVINYSIEGNLNISGVPSLDSPVDITGVGDGINSYFEIKTINALGSERLWSFLLPRALYKIGNVQDYADYRTQTTYLNTLVTNLQEDLTLEQMSIYRKDTDVVYFKAPYAGKSTEPCCSPAWPFNTNNATFNSENMGITVLSNVAYMYFGLSWSRLGLAYETGTVYEIDDVEKTPLSDSEIIQIIFSYINSLDYPACRIIGGRTVPELVETVLPSLMLFKGDNTIELNIGADDVRFITESGDYIITEGGDYLNLDEDSNIPVILTTKTGDILMTKDDEELIVGRILAPALPSRLSVTYVSSIKQNTNN